MTKKWIGTQIVLNNLANHSLPEDDFLKKKLSLAKEVLDLDTLIVWPGKNKKNLDLIQGICRDFEIKTYLWYPVLADAPLFRVRPEQAVETYNGLPGYGINGVWENLGQGEEDFLFLCPNDRQTISQIFNHYQKQISAGYFEGVFLDRIRFPSPANGLETLFTCFCRWCQEKFLADYQKNLMDYQKAIESFFRKLKTIDIKDWAVYSSLFDILRQDNLEKFYDFRQQSIYQITKIFAEEAKRRGKLVGLDVFTPSLAPLVSQDYRLLARTCDWMKPMIYCHTNGPAGLPLELSCFIRGILSINPSLEEGQLIQEISRMLGVQLPDKINNLLRDGVPEEIIYYERQKIKDYNLGEGIKIYPGIEAVQIPGICLINKKTLEKYLSLILELGLEGIVLSWNLLQIPEEVLRWVGDFLLSQ